MSEDYQTGVEMIRLDPGQRGKAFCEALGLDASKVLDSPITFYKRDDSVHVQYEATEVVTIEQYQEALQFVLQLEAVSLEDSE